MSNDKGTIHIFLVSSPLQVISVTNIMFQFLKSKNEDSLLFCEGERLKTQISDETLWTQVIYGLDTRPSLNNATKNLRHNFKILSEIINEYKHVELYISDLYWLLNNIVFSELRLKYGKDYRCTLFDEGMVLYQQNSSSLWRQCLKWLWQKTKGFKCTFISGKQKQQKRLVSQIFAYHPTLLGHSCIPIQTLNPELLKHSFEQLMDSASIGLAPNQFPEGGLLYLSQPYYRVMPLENFKELIERMVTYFRAQGIKDFYIKPHDADSQAWIASLEKDYGFIPFTKVRSGIAIETLATRLKFDIVVSIGSSALLNLKLFGFRHNVISYGLTETAKNHSSLRRAHQAIKRLYVSLNVSMIN